MGAHYGRLGPAVYKHPQRTYLHFSGDVQFTERLFPPLADLIHNCLEGIFNERPRTCQQLITYGTEKDTMTLYTMRPKVNNSRILETYFHCHSTVSESFSDYFQPSLHSYSVDLIANECKK